MATKKGNGKLDAKSFDTVSIPPFAGSTPVTGRYQRRTQIQYAILTTIGLLGFYNSKNSRVRVAGLSCLFPGAGFLAVGGFLGAIGLVLSVAVLPLSIFAWFGAGGLAFVLANWIVPAIISTSIAGDSVWEPAGPIVIVFVIALVIYMLRSGAARHATALKLRQSRNELLDKEEVAWQARAQPIPSPSEKRELSLEELRMLQHFIQVAHQAMDDWSNYSHVDQFQTAAFRYQLYGLQWLLALVQKYWMPSFHGYLKEGQEKTIDKSTTQDVMNYWKWESLWGKFTLDWDPAKRDNIMVTGYILLSVALYEKLTGDERYSTKDSLNFRITKGAQYKHNAESIFESLMENWDSCSYCLFPCEPNWIYTICNLVGIQGALAYEAIKHTGRVEPLLAGRYHRSFEEDFMNADGSVVALRSAITGFPMVGLTGVIGDVGAAGSCGAAMPNLARRLWLVSREAHIRKDARGKYTVDNLLGADKIDVGNYKKGAGYAFSLFAQCAAEFGEEELANDLLDQLEEHMHPTVASPSGNGAVVANGLSMIGCLNVFRARVCKRGDWENLILSGPDTAALAAPKLDAVPFPHVMVARCHPEAETGVSFVLRGPTDKKTVALGFKDLRNGAEYRLLEIGEGGKRTEVVGGIRSDGQGRTQVRVAVGDRSEFELRPVA